MITSGHCHLLMHSTGRGKLAAQLWVTFPQNIIVMCQWKSSVFWNYQITHPWKTKSPLDVKKWLSFLIPLTARLSIKKQSRQHQEVYSGFKGDANNVPNGDKGGHWKLGEGVPRGHRAHARYSKSLRDKSQGGKVDDHADTRQARTTGERL